MGEALRIEIRNNREALGPATAEAEGWLESHDASPKVAYLVAVTIEELVTNCIEYGYDDTAEHTIVMELKVVDGVLTMVVVDDGHEFNPLEAPPPDFEAKLEDRRIGGLGIHMLRKLSDSMTYERHDGLNRLTITKSMA